MNKKIYLSFAVQSMLGLATLFFWILAFFEPIFLPATVMMVILLFLSIAFNYYTILYKPKVALIYVAAAIIAALILAFGA